MLGHTGYNRIGIYTVSNTLPLHRHAHILFFLFLETGLTPYVHRPTLQLLLVGNRQSRDA